MSASVLGLDPAQLNELKSTINSDIRNALNSTAFDPEKAVDALEQKLDRIVLLLERLVDTISPVLLAATSASTPSAPFGAAQTIPTASYEPVTATFTSATPSTAPQKPANISPFPSASSHTDGFAELLAKHDGKTRTSSESVAHRAYRESFKLHQVDIRDTAEADSPALLQSICGSYPFKRVSPEEIRLQDYEHDVRYATEPVVPTPRPFSFGVASPLLKSPTPTSSKHSLTPSAESTTLPRPLFSFDPTLPPFSSPISPKTVNPAASPRSVKHDFFAPTLDSERYFFGLPGGKMGESWKAFAAPKVGEETTEGKGAVEDWAGAKRTKKEDSPTNTTGTSTPDLLSRPSSSAVPSPPSDSTAVPPPPSCRFESVAGTSGSRQPVVPEEKKQDSSDAFEVRFGDLLDRGNPFQVSTPLATTDRTVVPPNGAATKAFTFSSSSPVSPQPLAPASPTRARSVSPLPPAKPLSPLPSRATPSATTSTASAAAVSITPLYVPSLPPAGTRSFGGRSMKSTSSADAGSDTSTTPGVYGVQDRSGNGSASGESSGWRNKTWKSTSPAADYNKTPYVPPSALTKKSPPVVVPTGKKGSKGIGNGIINNHPRASRPRMRTSLSGSGSGSMTPIQEWVQSADAGGEATWEEREIVHQAEPSR